MRAFLAVEIPSEIREKYASLCRVLRKNSVLSFVQQEKMHITIAFFPDLPASKINDVMSIFKNIDLKPFTINCDNIGLFKRKGIPSTIFIKILSENLYEYTKQIHNYLMDLNIPFDNRKPFTPHITLARIREMINEDSFMKDYRLIVKQFEKSNFTAENINLYSSDMITYRILASHNFSNTNNNNIENI